MTVGTRTRVNVVITDAHLNVMTRFTEDNRSNEPAFSPNGRRLARVSGGRIHVTGLDGRHDRVVTDGFDAYPAWSPDGSALAFVRRSSPNELWRVDLDNGKQAKLASTPDIQDRPQWLSDGRIVYWTSNGVLAVPLSGGQPTLLVALTDRGVVFSPDGSKYAVESSTHGLPINVVDVAGGRVVHVPKSGTAVTEVLTWTTGNHLVFTQNVRGPDVNVVSWRPGDAKPRRIGRIAGLPIDLADNPRCSP